MPPQLTHRLVCWALLSAIAREYAHTLTTRRPTHKVSDLDGRLRSGHADRNGVSAALRSPVLGPMRHYVGSTRSLPQRLRAHREGDGGVTTCRAFDQGIGFTLARVWWPGTLRLERQIKAPRPTELLPVMSPAPRAPLTVPAPPPSPNRCRTVTHRAHRAHRARPPRAGTTLGSADASSASAARSSPRPEQLPGSAHGRQPAAPGGKQSDWPPGMPEVGGAGACRRSRGRFISPWSWPTAAVNLRSSSHRQGHSVGHSSSRM
jgi:hypothetical protein